MDSSANTYFTILDDSIIKHHFSLVFQGEGEKPILTIGANGHVVWTGDQSDVAKEFWQLVQLVGINVYNEGYQHGYKDGSQGITPDPVRRK